MNIDIYDIIAWIIAALLIGPLVGMIVTRKKAGYGRLKNFGIGLAGAIIGGILFKIFNLNTGLAHISINAQELLAGLLGALLFILILFIISKRRSKKTPTSKS
ncbi:MAG: GlsB/YeaQ/YmgE family stress response membrane protein [Verrucomicrobiota bacterium]